MRPNCTCLISFDIAQIQFRSGTLEQGRLAFGRMHRKSMQRELPFPSSVYEKLGGAAQVLRRTVRGAQWRFKLYWLITASFLYDLKPA